LFLSDKDITEVMRLGELRVEPELRGLQPSSVELHLGPEFKTYGYTPQLWDIDPEQPQTMVRQMLDRNGYWRIPPVSFALAHTVETVSVGTTLAAQVDGKSSLARLGLAVHMTSGFIGMVIAQMFVWRLSSAADRPYGSPGVDSRYQGQTGATPSRYGDRVPLAQVALNPHVVDAPEYPAESLEWSGSQAWHDTASRRQGG
jgi:dCTP deaminase